VVDAVAGAVSRYVDAAAHLGVLCTSQTPIGLDGEVTFDVEPLDHEQSVQLFARRAAEHRRSFELDEESGRTVHEVCASLDGLPLAIELAAARTKTLSVDEIAWRLHDRFALLSDPSSRRTERRRALGAAIAWSYDLLFPDDQRGLWALACFRGGARLDGAEHVLGALGVPAPAAVDVIGRLADRSLVVADLGDVSRYRLLDSIREYAVGRLREAGLHDVACAAHAAWCAALADDVAAGVRCPEQPALLVAVRVERANVDVALAWCADHDPALGLRIANGLGWAWLVLGDGPFGSERVRRALVAAADVASPAERFASLVLTAWLDSSNDVDAAIADAEAARRLAVELDDEHRVAIARTAAGFVHLQRGDAERAAEVLDGVAAIQHRLAAPWEELAAWVLTAYAALAVGDVAAAGRAAAAAEPLGRDLGDDWALDHVESVLGAVARSEGRLADAADRLRGSAAIAARLGFRTSEAYHLANLGRVLQQAGDGEGARAALEQAIDVGREAVDLRVVALARARLGEVLLAAGDREGAAEVVAAADHWFRAAGGGEDAELAARLMVELG
jgi:predicted ATPase